MSNNDNHIVQLRVPESDTLRHSAASGQTHPQMIDQPFHLSQQLKNATPINSSVSTNEVTQ